jgi:hypothetical protein
MQSIKCTFASLLAASSQASSVIDASCLLFPLSTRFRRERWSSLPPLVSLPSRFSVKCDMN